MRGYKEEGTTTTPFDMVMLNDLDRFHLVMDVIDRVPGLGSHAAALRQDMVDERLRVRAYTRRRRRGPSGDPRLDLAFLAVRVLVVNVGSSTIKLSLVSNGAQVAASTVAIGDGGIDESELAGAIDALGPCDAVGHRVVHGGSLFRDPVVVDDDVRTQLAGLVSLAPLHLPRELACIDLVHRLVPQVPTVACFDTAFHASMPEEASTYALPSAWRSRWGLRRFGFHGLSHAWASSRAAELLDIPGESLRIVTCHLGAGASLAAVRSGVSVDTTMGFTPLEGLVMATRAGSVDPGLVLWLIQHAGVAPEEVADAMEHRSGLRALAGTGDMVAILEAEARGEAAAQLAVRVYLHSLRAAVAAMAASMQGLDALVFTGGVGENASGDPSPGGRRARVPRDRRRPGAQPAAHSRRRYQRGRIAMPDAGRGGA